MKNKPTFQTMYYHQVVQNKKIFQQISIKDRQIQYWKIQYKKAKDNKPHSNTANNTNTQDFERKIRKLESNLEWQQKQNDKLQKQNKNAQAYSKYYFDLSEEYKKLEQKYKKCHKQREDLKNYINEAQIQERKQVDKEIQKILKHKQKKEEVKQRLKKRMQSSSDKALSAFYERMQKAIQQKKQIKMSNKRDVQKSDKIGGSYPKSFEQNHYKMIQEQSEEQTDQIQQYQALIESILQETSKTQKQYLIELSNYQAYQKLDLAKIQQLNRELAGYDVCKNNLSELSTQNNQLNKKLAIQKKQNEIYMNKIRQNERQCQFKINKQFKQITDLKNQNSAYQTKTKKLQQQLSQQKEDINQILQQNSKLHEQFMLKQNQVELLKQKIVQLELELELEQQKSNNDKKRYFHQSQQYEFQHKKLQLKLIEHQQIKVSYEATMEDYVKRMNVLNDQVQIQNHKFQNLTEVFKDLQYQMVKLKNHMKQNMIEKNLCIQKAEHDKLMKQKQLKVKQKQDEISRLKTEIQQKTLQIQQLKQKQPSFNSIKNLKQQIQTLINQIQALQRQNAQLKLQSLKKQQQKLKTNYQILQLKAEHNQQNNQYEHKKQSISSIRQSIIKQYIQHEKYSQFQQKQQNQNFDVMKVMLNEFVMMVEKLKTEKQAMVKELQLKDKQVKKLQQGAVTAENFNQKINQKIKLVKMKQIQMEEELSKCRDQLKQVQLTQVLMGLLKSMTKNSGIKSEQSQKDSQRIRNQQDPSSPTQQAANKNNKLSKIKQNLNKKQLKQNQSQLSKEYQQERQSTVCNSAVLLEFLMTLQSKALELIRKLKQSNLEFSPGKSSQIQQKKNEGQNVGQKKLWNQLQEKMIKQLLQFSHRLQQQSNSFHLLIQTLTSIFSQLQTQITLSLQLLQQLHKNNKKLKKLASDQLQIITRNL